MRYYVICIVTAWIPQGVLEVQKYLEQSHRHLKKKTIGTVMRNAAEILCLFWHIVWIVVLVMNRHKGAICNPGISNRT